jgi:hypothetical protein
VQCVSWMTEQLTGLSHRLCSMQVASWLISIK